jgi:hypothetical protein
MKFGQACACPYRKHLCHIILSNITDEKQPPVGAPSVVAQDQNGNEIRAGTRPAPTEDNVKRSSLGQIIGAFKSITTHQYTLCVRENRWPSFDRHLLQRNYYESITRNDRGLNAIRIYIQANPDKWVDDPDNPINL